MMRSTLWVSLARNRGEVGEDDLMSEFRAFGIFVNGHEVGTEDELNRFPGLRLHILAYVLNCTWICKSNYLGLLRSLKDLPRLDHPVELEATILIHGRECVEIELTLADVIGFWWHFKPHWLLSNYFQRRLRLVDWRLRLRLHGGRLRSL